MKFMLLTVACAALSFGQINGVVLTGPASAPTIENHSGKTIIAAMLYLTHADGWVEPQMNTFIERNPEIPDAVANEIPDGGSKVWRTASKYQKVTNPVIAAKIAAVIFADGELRGQDAYQFQAIKEREFQSARQVWQMAKAGDWAGVKAKADINAAGDIVGVVAAERLLWEKSKHGEAEAVKSLAHYGLLPASTWKGGLLNKLRIVPDVFQAIVPIATLDQKPDNSGISIYRLVQHPTYGLRAPVVCLFVTGVLLSSLRREVSATAARH